MAKEENPAPEQLQAEIDVALPVDEHFEEVHVDGERVRIRGVYLLPNLLTTGALFAGFFAVVAAMDGRFEAAAIAIFVAMFFDGLDGRVARLTNTQSAFGVEYDSLSDMVSFGVAPALVMFSWALSSLGKLGWGAAFVYVAAAALRLARFNTQVDDADKRFFKGLASPSAAALLAALVWTFTDYGFVGDEVPFSLALAGAVATVGVGLLMVVNVPYHSFKNIDPGGRVPFVFILLTVLILGVITIDPPVALLSMAATYALSGPFQHLLIKFQRAEKTAQQN